jgi:type II secretory pathway predicted ATPase ExeA
MIKLDSTNPYVISLPSQPISDYEGSPFKCEKRLIEEAYTLFRNGKSIIMIIDDAHLMEMETLRKLRLLFEDFPKSHNIILVGQPHLLNNIALKVNDDIKSRVTFSTIIQKLNPDDMHNFILSQFDQVKLPHNTLEDDAFALIVRSSDGILRRARNLTLSCLLEAVRARKKIIGLDIVNRVLLQPHWRLDSDVDMLF